jgi:hypothetical protein
MIRTDAFTAQNAFAQIPGNEGIGLFKRFEIRHGIEVGFTDAECGGRPSQRATVPFAANHAGFGVFRYHKTDNVAAVIQYARGLGQNRLAGRRG